MELAFFGKSDAHFCAHSPPKIATASASSSGALAAKKWAVS
jgi:hypothetical protein